MALRNTFHLPGGIEVPDAYMIPDGITASKITGIVTGNLKAYRTEETRRTSEKLQKASRDAQAASKLAQSAAAELQTKPLGDEDPDERAAKQLALNKTARAAQADAESAAAAAGEDDGAFFNQSFAFDADISQRAIRTDGTIDMSVVYDAIKKQFPKATDLL